MAAGSLSELQSFPPISSPADEPPVTSTPSRKDAETKIMDPGMKNCEHNDFNRFCIYYAIFAIKKQVNFDILVQLKIVSLIYFMVSEINILTKFR